MIIASIDYSPFIILGLALGGVFATSGVGLMVLYRTTGVLNLAYGAVGALGAMVSWQLVNQNGWSIWLGSLACVLVCVAVMLLMGWVFGAAFAHRDAVVKLVASSAVAIGLLGVIGLLWRVDVRALPLPTSNSSFKVGSVYVTYTQLISLIFGLAVAAAAAAFLRFTKFGTAMRALADNREASAILGIPTRRIEAAAWGMSGVLCGISGVLLADLFGLDYVGLTFLVVGALAAALVGRLRSIWATVAAAFGVGILQSVLTPTSVTDYRTLSPFAVTFVAALWLGRRPAPTRMVGALRITSWQVTSRVTTRGPAARWAPGAVFVLLALFVIPAITDNYWLGISTNGVVYTSVTLGLGLLMGQIGLPVLYPIGIMAVSSWVALRLGYATNLPFVIVMLLSGVAAGVIGALVGLPALRIGGLYLGIITLMAAAGFSLLLSQINFPNGGGGFLGFSSDRPSSAVLSGPAIATSTEGFYRYVVIVAVAMFALVAAHLATKPGRAWTTIRDSEPTAVSAGINVRLYKIWGLALAGFVTGIAGALLAASPGGVTPEQFGTVSSLMLVTTVIIAGMYSLPGAVLAAVLSQVLPAAFNSWGINSNLLLVLFGLGAVQALGTAPGGLVRQVPADLRRLGRLVRRTPATSTEPSAA
jgi:ABC-type branched-subunit amino acid transport system permease subunit